MSVARRRNVIDYSGVDNELIQNQLIEHLKQKESRGDLKITNTTKRVDHRRRDWKTPYYVYKHIQTTIYFTTHKIHESGNEFFIPDLEDANHGMDQITFFLKIRLGGPATLEIYEDGDDTIYFPIGDDFVRTHLFECFDVWFDTKRRPHHHELNIEERELYWAWRKRECKKRLKLYKRLILEDIPKLEVLSLASPLLRTNKNPQSQLSNLPFEIFQNIVNMSKSI